MHWVFKTITFLFVENMAKICKHKRQRYRCRECGGNGICEHNRVKSSCKVCFPNRNYPPKECECVPQNTKLKSNCRVCSPDNFCLLHPKQNGSFKSKKNCQQCKDPSCVPKAPKLITASSPFQERTPTARCMQHNRELRNCLQCGKEGVTVHTKKGVKFCGYQAKEDERRKRQYKKDQRRRCLATVVEESQPVERRESIGAAEPEILAPDQDHDKSSGAPEEDTLVSSPPNPDPLAEQVRDAWSCDSNPHDQV